MNYSKDGLTDKEVIESRRRYGTNSIKSNKKNSIFKLILESLNDPIIKILIIALGIKVIFLFKDSDIFETIGILLAILVASIISALSEYGSEKAFQKLEEDNDKIKIKTYRNKNLSLIDIEDIVVGDIIKLEGGDKIGADGILIDGEIYTDESALTGETKEKIKRPKDKVFRGSIVTNKSGIMKVTVVGEKTFYGEVAKSIEEKSPDSPLKNRLKVLASTISKIGYICAFLVMISYLFNVLFISNKFNLNLIKNLIIDPNFMFPHLLYSLTLAVTIIVVAVPEGLPLMVTLVLSSNMKRMMKNNVLVKKLVGIETSGNINILFTDKTGTITKGKLEVIGLLTPNGINYKKLNNIKNNKLNELYSTSLSYNNNSVINNEEVIGSNTTDRAIRRFIKVNKDNKYKVIKEELFDSKKKYSSITLNNNITYYKGAYEVFKNKLLYYYDDNCIKKRINSNDISLLIDKYTKKGIRVITLVIEEYNIFSLLGFVLIKDEVRPESIEGLKLVKKAGVQTVMITGDSLLTATGIAREVGLLTRPNDILITSEELNKLNDEEVKKILPDLRVVARSLPNDKKRLVELSEELGLVVGMTGDGVNDAPALKKANVGFAMGSGTEVAKEVSDIVILDDNLLSISKAILYGRTIFKSIRKFIIFQLTVNLCAVGLSIIGPFINVIEPVTVMQMLWVNMIMDTLAGIAFAYEPPLKEYMNELPKKTNEQIMNKYMINEILITGLFEMFLCIFFLKSNFIHSLFRIDNNDKYVMTAFFGLFIFLAIFNSFNARTHRINILGNILKNKAFIIVISFIVLVQLILIYFGGEIFRTTGLTFIEFQIMLVLSLSIIPFDFLRKIILKKRGTLSGC